MKSSNRRRLVIVVLVVVVVVVVVSSGIVCYRLRIPAIQAKENVARNAKLRTRS